MRTPPTNALSISGDIGVFLVYLNNDLQLICVVSIFVAFGSNAKTIRVPFLRTMINIENSAFKTFLYFVLFDFARMRFCIFSLKSVLKLFSDNLVE